MSVRWLGTLFAAFSLCFCASAFASDADRKSAARYDSYRIVVERNVFDPYRKRPRPPEPPRRVEARKSEPEPRRDEYVRLSGVMLSPKNAVAFFEGSRSEYSVQVAQGKSIADHRVVQILPGRVWLEKDGGWVELPVGYRLEERDGKKWEVREDVPRSESGYSRDTRETSDSRSEGSGGTSSSPGSDRSETSQADSGGGEKSSDAQSDLARRMMERRRKEEE